MEIKISKELISVGIVPNIKGYYYLKEAILYIIEDKEYLYNLNNKLYPAVAQKYKKIPGAIERAIRYAISKTGKKISNRDFIIEIIEKIQLTN